MFVAFQSYQKAIMRWSLNELYHFIVAVVLGGSCPGRQLSWVEILLDGSCPG